MNFQEYYSAVLRRSGVRTSPTANEARADFRRALTETSKIHLI